MNKLNLDYTPHAEQQKVHDSEARFKVINHGIRAGGTRCALMDGLMYYWECLNEDRPESIEPKAHWAIAAPSSKTARHVWNEVKRLVPSDMIVGTDESTFTIQTVQGGKIEIIGAGDVESGDETGIDILTMDCASYFTNLLDMFGALEGRLNSYGRGVQGKGGAATIVNSGRKSAEFTQIYDYSNPESNNYDPDWEGFTFTTWDNPDLAKVRQEREEKLRRRLGSERYREHVLAEFV